MALISLVKVQSWVFTAKCSEPQAVTVIGTSQGGPLSPLLSNIMLNKLDKELEARGLYCTRYADDTIILVKSEKAANRVMESIS